jgi:tetratricopeptide (TPR) repeat protein
MHADLLVVQICDFLNDGDGMYRIHEPSRYLSRLPGVVVIDCHYHHHLLPRLLELADVLVLQFCHNWDFLPIIERRRNAGQVSVFEANDYFFDVQPWNPIAPGWRDPAIQAEYRKFMAHCDAVQTSTEFLAEKWKPLARRVAVFHNQLTQIPPLLPPPARPLTIGWGGSPGHFADWYAIAPLLRRWLSAHPDVHLAVMCNDFAKPFFDLPPSRYHFTPFGPLSTYLDFLKSIDIGLAPLLPTGYNRGRSDVKFLEFATSGVAGIFADLDPYRTSVQDGKTGFLYSSGEQLLARLDQLTQDIDLRHRIRAQAHQYVSEHRRLEQHVSARFDFYRSLFASSPRGADVPEEAISAAVIDGRYLQLRSGEIERAFSATQRPTPSESATAIADVARRYPNYHHALLRHGRHLNDAKQFGHALPVLNRAAELEPLSAAVLCEIGRTYYLTSDYEKAQESFEKAMKINPDFHPGWQYFLRFLRHTRRPDADRWAQQARQRFPDDFGLALLAIAVYPPPEQLLLLHQLLDLTSARPHPEDFASVTAFATAAAEAIKSTSATADAAALLRRACEVFPQSAKLADMLGRILYAMDEIEDSSLHYCRALALRHAAKAYAADFSREDGSFYIWQFADHIHQCQSDESPENE